MKRIFNVLIVWPLSKIKKYVLYTISALTLSIIVAGEVWLIWDYNLSKLKVQGIESIEPGDELETIHSKIQNVTEVSNRVPPIWRVGGISSLIQVNAFTNGHGVYFTIAADMILSKDEKALIMGHEIAHVILHHTDNEYIFIRNHSNEDELMADNLGAVWASKAGYNVCRGREVFLKFYEWSGNSLNGSHPPNKYRYDNLQHYCKGN